MTTNPPTVLGIGELLWDNLPGGRQLGGAPGNFAFHCHQHGLDAAPASAVGDDPEGRDLLAALRQRAVRTDFIETVDHPTGTVEVQLDADGKPTYDIRRGVAWDFVPQSDRLMAAAESADAVCYGSLAQREPTSMATVRAVLDATPPDCLRVFDVNLREPFYDAKIVRSGLESASVFKLNDEEIPLVAGYLGLPSKEAAFAEGVLDKFGLRLLVVTRGGSGSLLKTPAEQDEHSGVKVEVVSTVGAGDSFTATVVAGLLAGLPLAEVHDRAARVAAYVCTQSGAMPTLPDALRIGVDTD